MITDWLRPSELLPCKQASRVGTRMMLRNPCRCLQGTTVQGEQGKSQFSPDPTLALSCPDFSPPTWLSLCKLDVYTHRPRIASHLARDTSAYPCLPFASHRCSLECKLTLDDGVHRLFVSLTIQSYTVL